MHNLNNYIALPNNQRNLVSVECSIGNGSWFGVSGIIGGDDCDDTNENINPNSIWYIDDDGVGARIAIEADIAGAASDIEKVLT